jgi:hypothetical protein
VARLFQAALAALPIRVCGSCVAYASHSVFSSAYSAFRLHNDRAEQKWGDARHEDAKSVPLSVRFTFAVETSAFAFPANGNEDARDADGRSEPGAVAGDV